VAALRERGIVLLDRGYLKIFFRDTGFYNYPHLTQELRTSPLVLATLTCSSSRTFLRVRRGGTQTPKFGFSPSCYRASKTQHAPMPSQISRSIPGGYAHSLTGPSHTEVRADASSEMKARTANSSQVCNTAMPCRKWPRQNGVALVWRRSSAQPCLSHSEVTLRCKIPPPPCNRQRHSENSRTPPRSTSTCLSL